MNKGYYQYFIFILLFILGVLICNYTWFQEDDSIEGSGAPNHVGFSIEFFYKLSDIINEKSLTLGSKVNQIVYLLGNPVKFSCVEWPNGLNTTASVFYYLFGKSLFSAKLSLMPYLIILLLSTYLIGRTLFSDFVGLLAMFLLYMYPLIFESFRQFQLDSPLTAMVALSI
ncbi:MAG: glycosyltransferase family 39 protein, partial [Candidatus Omnitrophica bacterium]|nr:glycosyltransferase family 39 protein [Candidatus Omnitrophota bacterium]